MENTNTENIAQKETENIVQKDTVQKENSSDEEQETPMTPEEKAVWAKIDGLLKEHYLTAF
jgi:hypothetical protein